MKMSNLLAESAGLVFMPRIAANVCLVYAAGAVMYMVKSLVILE